MAKKVIFLLEMPGAREVFTHRRYKQITKYLDYYSPGTAPDPKDETRDRAFKIRYVTDHMKNQFQEVYVCGESVAVDECVVPFRGWLSIKQYFKDKPVRWGIKLWMLCDSKSGYCFNFDIYSGRDEDFSDLNNINITSAVVMKLCLKLNDSHRTVYTDRYYSSPSLAFYLNQLGLEFCGTVMINRSEFPKELVKKPTCKQGEFQWLMCQETNIVAVRWCDKRPIYLLSTGFRPECTGIFVIRHNK